MGGQLTEVADVLERAADLIARPGAWAQEITYAQDAEGRSILPYSDDAKCFCLIGAIAHEWRIAAGLVESKLRALPTVNAILCGDEGAPANWNDAPGRTQAEVVAALRSAAAAARQQEHPHEA